MMLADPLALTLVSFGLGLLIVAAWAASRREGPLGLHAGLAVAAIAGLGTFVALSTEAPAALLNSALRTFVPALQVPPGRVIQIDLAAGVGGFALNAAGFAVGLGLALLIRLAARRSGRHPRRRWTVGLPLIAVGIFAILGTVSAVATLPPPAPAGAIRKAVQVPPGFTVRSLVTGLQRPTVARFGPDGRLYVAVHRVVGSTEQAGDDFAGEIISFSVGEEDASDRRVFASGLGLVTGLAFRDDTLYVSHALIAAQRGEIVRLRDTDGDGRADERRVLIGNLLAGRYLWHQNQQIAFGPDGRLYIGQGGTSDHGPEREQLGGTILTARPDGSDLRIFARGFRNPFSLVFTPQGELLVTDNGPDFYPTVASWTDRGAPVDELNLVVEGNHYGYPEAFGFPPPWSRTRPPIAIWPPHNAPGGITIYTAKQFPTDYQGDVFVVLFLPGKLHRAVLHRDPTSSTIRWAEVQEFASGFRLPVDVTVSPAGELIVTEFGGGSVQAIAYKVVRGQ